MTTSVYKQFASNQPVIDCPEWTLKDLSTWLLQVGMDYIWTQDLSDYWYYEMQSEN